MGEIIRCEKREYQSDQNLFESFFEKYLIFVYLSKLSMIRHSIFTEKPSKADDYLDVDWVPNQNLGGYSKNWKRVEYYIRKKNDSRVYLQLSIFYKECVMSFNLSISSLKLNFGN